MLIIFLMSGLESKLMELNNLINNIKSHPEVNNSINKVLVMADLFSNYLTEINNLQNGKLGGYKQVESTLSLIKSLSNHVPENIINLLLDGFFSMINEQITINYEEQFKVLEEQLFLIKEQGEKNYSLLMNKLTALESLISNQLIKEPIKESAKQLISELTNQSVNEQSSDYLKAVQDYFLIISIKKTNKRQLNNFPEYKSELTNLLNELIKEGYVKYERGINLVNPVKAHSFICNKYDYTFKTLDDVMQEVINFIEDKVNDKVSNANLINEFKQYPLIVIKKCINDYNNSLINKFYNFIKELKEPTIQLINDYERGLSKKQKSVFKRFINKLKKEHIILVDNNYLMIDTEKLKNYGVFNESVT